jgi:hypothetical protein
MKKLHSDGLLISFDFESHETCEACMLGKMTKTPFIGFPERASDLLELIHIDVYGSIVTPDFNNKTECITICMPGSSSIHVVTSSVNNQQKYHEKRIKRL